MSFSSFCGCIRKTKVLQYYSKEKRKEDMLPQDEIFKNKAPLKERLERFGFAPRDGGVYVYAAPVLEGQFRFEVTVDGQGDVAGRVFDTDTGDEYVLYRAESASGAFIGQLRTACLSILQKIADICCVTKVFQSPGAAAVIRYAKEKYGDEPEFLWEKFPGNAVLRRKDTQKWYAALLKTTGSKIGLVSDEAVEIVDLRMTPDDIAAKVDGRKYFAGYHMNKKHWATLLLDGSVPEAELLALIDASYELARK